MDLAVWYFPDCVSALCRVPGVSINMPNSDGNTPLHRFGHSNRDEIIFQQRVKICCLKFLFKRNIDFTLLNKNGISAFQLALQSKNYIAAYLIGEYMTVDKKYASTLQAQSGMLGTMSANNNVELEYLQLTLIQNKDEVSVVSAIAVAGGSPVFSRANIQRKISVADLTHVPASPGMGSP